MKKLYSICVLSILSIGISAGYQMDGSKPETNRKTSHAINKTIIDLQAFPVSTLIPNTVPSLYVHYEMTGNQLLVECILTGISFRESDQSKQKIGKLVVWIDGKKIQEATTAAFIIKDLSPGEHKVRLEVVNLHNAPYGLSKEFMVNISK